MEVGGVRWELHWDRYSALCLGRCGVRNVGCEVQGIVTWVSIAGYRERVVRNSKRKSVTKWKQRYTHLQLRDCASCALVLGSRTPCLLLTMLAHGAHKHLPF